MRQNCMDGLQSRLQELGIDRELPQNATAIKTSMKIAKAELREIIAQSREWREKEMVEKIQILEGGRLGCKTHADIVKMILQRERTRTERLYRTLLGRYRVLGLNLSLL